MARSRWWVLAAQLAVIVCAALLSRWSDAHFSPDRRIPSWPVPCAVLTVLAIFQHVLYTRRERG